MWAGSVRRRVVAEYPIAATTRSHYNYVNGDPLNATDPTGLRCWGWIAFGPFGCRSFVKGAVVAFNQAMQQLAIAQAAEGGVVPCTYHRLENATTQTPETGRLQRESGEIWGYTPTTGFQPAVQAYEGPLPEGAHGIEFVTYVDPSRTLPAPGGRTEVRWEPPVVPVEYDTTTRKDKAILRVIVTKLR